MIQSDLCIFFHQPFTAYSLKIIIFSALTICTACILRIHFLAFSIGKDVEKPYDSNFRLYLFSVYQALFFKNPEYLKHRKYPRILVLKKIGNWTAGLLILSVFLAAYICE